MVVAKKIPFFSILLPTYNRDDLISTSIKSVLNQTFTNYELMVVGDGCTDSTEKIVKRISSEDSRVKWFPFSKGKGFGYSNRNIVLKKSNGKYIAWMPHDDIWFPDHLEYFFKFLSENPSYKFVYSRPIWMHSDGTLIPSYFNLQNTSTRKLFLNSHNEIPAYCVVLERKIAESVGYLNSNLSHAADWDLWKKIYKKQTTPRIGFISVPTGIHFKANWRTNKNYLNERFLALHLKIKGSRDFSQSLRVKKEKGVPIQVTTLKLVEKKVWVSTFRQNIVAYLDSILEEIAYTMQENNNLKLNIRAMKATKGYKILEKLRKIDSLLKK